MRVWVNGEIMELEDGSPLPGLLERMGKAVDRVAVERNGEILDRERIATTVLREQDRLEIVHFVGGG